MRSLRHRIGLATLVAALGLALQAQAGIINSAHDFSGSGWSSGQICLPCHTPHDANTGVSLAPLWNHELTTQTFTPYTSGTLNATVGQPGGVSKLCLSCHDATVAIDSFGGTTGTTTIAAAYRVGEGGDMRDEHPISFTYNTALSTDDGELYDPVTATTALGGTIQNDLLFSDQVECGSCHDVHNTNVAANPLLRITNAGSALCLTCHNK